MPATSTNNPRWGRLQRTPRRAEPLELWPALLLWGKLQLARSFSSAGTTRKLLCRNGGSDELARNFSYAVVLAAALSITLCAQTLNQAHTTLAIPPPDARIMMRWWWFGPTVTNAELEAELRMMQYMGIGGVEIQPVYPLVLDDPKTLVNLRYLSDDYLARLKFTSAKARELNLRMDITLGSGWPFGGPHIPVTEAAGRLRLDRVPIPANAKSIPVPDIGAGEKLLAIFAAKGDPKRPKADSISKLEPPKTPRLQVPPDATVALLFIASRTGQQVKRPANGAEGFVLDHYSRSAIEHHLKVVGDRLLTAFGDNPPYSVFSDSLEVYNSDWTDDLLTEFKARRGYDLTDFLPALDGGLDGELKGKPNADVRHDWGLTLSELCDERYLKPINEWAHKNNTKFRSQTYGIPPVTLSSNALVDLPEGEHGPFWRTFSVARWAASASHLYSRPVTSSETWTWLHSPVFRATPLDMKAEADRHFLQGINQLVGHGWPYSPPEAGEPGWRFYAAAVFNNHNPWWQVMPDVSRYLQRVSALLRLGKPANDVALYLPTHDAFAGFTAGSRTSVDQAMEALLGPTLIPQILDAGYNFDFIDDAAIASVGIPHPALVIPNLKRMPEATQKLIDGYKAKGGIVVDLRTGIDLTKELTAKLQPGFATGVPDVGFIHRKLDDGDLFFVANTGNKPVHTAAAVRLPKDLQPEWWSPDTGRRTTAVVQKGNLIVDLAPYESRIAVYSRSSSKTDPPPTEPQTLSDLSVGWKITWGDNRETTQMDRLHSWTDDESTLYYSGNAAYERGFRYDAKPGQRVYLSFGEGTPVEAPRRAQGFQALLDSPVRETAIVMVNGKPAGTVWHPPYEVEITTLLQPGTNQLRIFVANLAVNAMAGQKQPDYKLLNLRYAERFTPQDMDKIQPLPSGLLGKVTLVSH